MAMPFHAVTIYVWAKERARAHGVNGAGIGAGRWGWEVTSWVLEMSSEGAEAGVGVTICIRTGAGA